MTSSLARYFANHESYFPFRTTTRSCMIERVIDGESARTKVNEPKVETEILRNPPRVRVNQRV